MSKVQHHPLAGQIVTIKSGPLKGHMYHVIDFMSAQHQGKDMSRIKSPLIYSVKQRGYPLDNEVVFGKLLPNFGFFCVHDTELQRDAESKNEDIKTNAGGEGQPKAAKDKPDTVIPITSSTKSRVRRGPTNKTKADL